MGMVAWGGNKPVHNRVSIQVLKWKHCFIAQSFLLKSIRGVPKVVVLLCGFFISNQVLSWLCVQTGGLYWDFFWKAPRISYQMHAKTAFLLLDYRKMERLTVNWFGLLALWRNRVNWNKPVRLSFCLLFMLALTLFSFCPSFYFCWQIMYLYNNVTMTAFPTFTYER